MFHVAERLMTMSLPAEAVARISQGEFAPARFDEVLTMTRESAVYLKPGIEKLPGMRHYFAAVSPLGSIVHVSLWDSDEQANRMSRLNEMIVSARSHAEAVGVGLP
jgi:hypothetical protein